MFRANLARVLTGTLVLLTPTLASANFVLLHAPFDGKATGVGLGRGGALAGEPVEGVFDTHSELVLVDAGTDKSVQCVDTSNLAGNNDQLFFQFLYGHEVSDGVLHVEGNVTPEALDTYLFDLRGADFLFNFFHLSWDGAGLVYWGDGDTVISSFTTYTAGVEVAVELVFDLDAGTYDFIYDGTTILTAEPHGQAGGIGALVVGNQFDGNATGSVRFDDLEVWWEPGTATTWLSANFNNKTIGAPIGTGGAAVGEPTSIDPGIETEVLFGVTPTRSLEIRDDSDTAAGYASFEFLGGSTLGAGSLSVEFDVIFDSHQNAGIVFTEPASSAEIFADFRITDWGDILVYDSAGGPAYQVSYTAGARIQIALWFNAELEIYSLWMDGVRVLERRAHGVLGNPLGAIHFGHGYDLDFDGAFRLDNLKVQHLVDPLTSTPETLSLPGGAILHPAHPNPFNPQTTLSYELERSGPVRLTVFDARGRAVATLVNGTQVAGSHQVQWSGLDAAGRSVASGVYRALLTAGGSKQMIPMTLVK